MRCFLFKPSTLLAETLFMLNINEGIHLSVNFAKWCLIGAGSLLLSYFGIKLIVMLLFLNILYTF